MHTSRVKVLRGPITFGGWKGRLTLDGDLMTVEEDEVGRSLVISLADVKRASYNSNKARDSQSCPEPTNRAAGCRLRRPVRAGQDAEGGGDVRILAAQFEVSRPTVYRVLERHHTSHTSAIEPTEAETDR
jgi:hypothetical protein